MHTYEDELMLQMAKLLLGLSRHTPALSPALPCLSSSALPQPVLCASQPSDHANALHPTPRARISPARLAGEQPAGAAATAVRVENAVDQLQQVALPLSTAARTARNALAHIVSHSRAIAR